MPTFPTYHGPPLPKALNPLNPLHYLTVLKWVFFQPSCLKHYLYQADPDLYSANGRQAMQQTLRLSAYRNLYMIALIVSLLAAVGMACTASVTHATSINSFLWERLLAVGVALGVSVGVALGVSVGVALGVSVGVVVVVAGAMAGTVVGVVAGAVAGTVAGVVAGVVAFGVAFGVALGVSGGIAVGVVFGVAVGVVFGVALSVMLGAIGGVMLGVAFVAGVQRLIFYPFELIWAWMLLRFTRSSRGRLRWHPARWDELAVWPLPGLACDLQQQLTVNFDEALIVILNMAANPFQRWSIQRALSDWLAEQLEVLAALYGLVSARTLSDYVALPVERDQFRDFSAGRVVVLGEIAQVYIDRRDIDYTSTMEGWVWRLTCRLRRTQPTPVSRLAEVLYDLARRESDYEKSAVVEIKLAERFAPNYAAVCDLPHGVEIAGSFTFVDAALQVQVIADMATIGSSVKGLSEVGDTPVRKVIVEACRALADVSAQVAVAERATNLNRQETALNLAAGALQELLGYIDVNVLTPERVLFKRVVQHWQSLVAQAQGQLGATALRQMSLQLRQASGLDAPRQSVVWQRPLSPLDNPYVVGNPVTGSLFVGRATILNRIGEVWSAKAHPDSIILYGHRRMGKSSILRNLAQAARPASVIVYVDLLGETSFIASTADLLLGLANKVYATVHRANPTAGLTPPKSAAYTSASRAQIEFDRLTEQVRDVLQSRSVILALDEFEAVEKAIGAGKIGTDIYQFLRTKTQDPLFTFVLGGLHTLDEMSRDYQQPFYGSYDNIRVSYLTHDEAWQLITNPTPNFELNYEPAAVEHIMAKTGGQPYLIQLVCRDALDHLNHELFDEHKEREVKLTLADVDAVLGDDLFRRGTGYFDGVWTQVSEAAQQNLLRCMAQREEAWALAELEAQTHLALDVLRHHLQLAQRRDILRQHDGVWEFCVPLMRRWIIWKE